MTLNPRWTSSALVAASLFVVGACGGGDDYTPPPDPEKRSSELHSQGIVEVDPSEFGIVTLTVAVDEHADPDICTGTVLRDDWVLTTKDCVRGALPAQVSVATWSTHGGPYQQTEAAAIVQHPLVNAALVRLRTPFNLGWPTTFQRPVASTIPTAGHVVRCFAFDVSSGRRRLYSQAFAVSQSNESTYTVDDSAGALEWSDIGTSCSDDSAGSTVGPIVGLVSSIGASGTHTAAGYLETNHWIDDMINLASIADRSSYAFGIQSVWDHQCFDVEAGSIFSGARVNQFPCHGGPDQRWYLADPGQPWDQNHLQSLVSTNSGKCLEVGPASWLRQATCNGNATQRFGKTFIGAHGWQLTVPSGLCADIPGFTSMPGKQIHMFPCDSGPNQAWQTY